MTPLRGRCQTDDGRVTLGGCLLHWPGIGWTHYPQWLLFPVYVTCEQLFSSTKSYSLKFFVCFKCVPYFLRISPILMAVKMSYLFRRKCLIVRSHAAVMPIFSSDSQKDLTIEHSKEIFWQIGIQIDGATWLQHAWWCDPAQCWKTYLNRCYSSTWKVSHYG